MIEESANEQPDAQHVQDVRRQSDCRALYFGGVAFKYQRRVQDVQAAARKAMRFMDVVTTSGPGTGQAADISRIRLMKEALGEFPLAIASGISPKNVGAYLPYSDCYLVATGISTDFSHLNPILLRALMEEVRSYGNLKRTDSANSAGGRIGSVCLVCEWNEGRSVHLELMVRKILGDSRSSIQVGSAGLSQGGGVSARRGSYLMRRGISSYEIETHRSRVFDANMLGYDIVLVAEAQMKGRLLAQWPSLRGRVMTIRGFVLGHSLANETLTEDESRIEDAEGCDEATKLRLYAELDEMALRIAERLLRQRDH